MLGRGRERDEGEGSRQPIRDEVAVIGKPGDGSWAYSPADRQKRGRGPKSKRPNGSITGIEDVLVNKKVSLEARRHREAWEREGSLELDPRERVRIGGWEWEDINS